MERQRFEQNKQRHGLLEGLRLEGPQPAPSQVWGAIRIVPLIRTTHRGDLRMGALPGGSAPTSVRLNERGLRYTSYVPAGLLVTWEDERESVVAWAGALERAGNEERATGWAPVRARHRMVRRLGSNQVRMLPLHLAIEGFLGMHFGGPDVAHHCYSERARRRGLDPRTERTIVGEQIPYLRQALRLFELHEGQCGALLYVGDVLASAAVVPSPQDWRSLHGTILQDHFARELLYHADYDEVPAFELELEDRGFDSLEQLRRGFELARRQWADFEVDLMGQGLIGRDIISERVYQLGAFRLQRFITDLSEPGEQHIGEVIVREGGALEYLRTMRLSRDQVRRARLLELLAAHQWNLRAAASELDTTPHGLARRLERAGLGFLLRAHLRPKV